MAIRGSSLAGAVIPVGGPAGLPGQGTYQAWLALGNTGTLADFMAAQKGADGKDGRFQSINGFTGPNPSLDDIRASAKELQLPTQAAATGLALPAYVPYFRVAGRKDIGDGGHGLFKVVSAEPPHRAKIPLAGNQWGELSEFVSVDVCLFGDGLGQGADDALAFQKASEYLAYRGGGTIRYHLRHQIKTSWTLNQAVSLQGPGLNADPGNTFAFELAGNGDPRRTTYLSAMRTGPGLVFDPNVSLFVGGRQTIDGVAFYSSAMKFDGTDLASAMAGECLFAQFIDSTTIRKAAFIGFNVAMSCDECARMRFEDVFADSVNVLKYYRAFDIWDIDRLSAFNVTSPAPTLGDTTSLRLGTLVELTGLHGGPRINDLFGYGYQLGLDLQGPAAETINGLWLDGPVDPNTFRPLNPAAVGLRITSGSNSNATIDDNSAANIKLVNPKFLSQGVGIVLGEGNYGAVSVINPEFQHCDRYCDISGLGYQMVNADCGPKGIAPGIRFNNPAAANSARLTNGYIAGNESLLDINHGGGKAMVTGWRRANGQPMTHDNMGLAQVSIVSGGSLAIPSDEDVCTVYVTGGGNIGNMGARWPGRRVTVVFRDATTAPVAGSSFYDDPSSGNFKTKGGFLATAGSSITFVFDPNLNKWSEIGRTLY